jgi:guanine nucleotide-binding protein subunit beta-2-like 1 protein
LEPSTVSDILNFEGHNGWVTSLSVGQDSKGQPLLVSGSRDRTLIVWSLDLENPQEEYNIEGKPLPNDQRRVGKPLKSLKGHSHFVSSVSISKDSNFVVSGSWDKTLRLWDLNTFRTIKLFSGHTKDVLATTFTHDNRMIISGGMDKTMRIWNTKGENKHTSTEFDGWVSSLTHLKQGKDSSYIAVGIFICIKYRILG